MYNDKAKRTRRGNLLELVMIFLPLIVNSQGHCTGEEPCNRRGLGPVEMASASLPPRNLDSCCQYPLQRASKGCQSETFLHVFLLISVQVLWVTLAGSCFLLLIFFFRAVALPVCDNNISTELLLSKGADVGLQWAFLLPDWTKFIDHTAWNGEW